MRADLHVHSQPISCCAQFQTKDIPPMMRSAGIGLFNLSNHFYPGHLNHHGATLAEQIDNFIKCWQSGLDAACECDITMLFGIEVKLINVEHNPEFLLFGMTPEKLCRLCLPLYNFSQAELYDLCNSEDLLMYQAHPYRLEQNYAPADPSLMHGMELYNGHLRFNPNYDLTKAFIEEHNLPYSAGSDFHDPEDLGQGGIFLPSEVANEIATSEDLRDWMRAHPGPEFYKTIEY